MSRNWLYRAESPVYVVPRPPRSNEPEVAPAPTSVGAGAVCGVVACGGPFGGGVDEDGGPWAAAGAAVDSRPTMAETSRGIRIGGSSAQEELSHRVHRPVDLDVAIDATPILELRLGQLRGVVERARVPRRDMTPLAEQGLLGDEHAVILRSVRVVARR